VCDQPFLEERAWPVAARPVDELIGDHDMSRREILAQRSAGADADHLLHAQQFQRVDIGAIGNFTRREHVPAPVAWNERDALASQRPDHHSVARLAIRRVDNSLLDVGQIGHAVDAGPPNDPYSDRFHEPHVS